MTDLYLHFVVLYLLVWYVRKRFSPFLYGFGVRSKTLISPAVHEWGTGKWILAEDHYPDNDLITPGSAREGGGSHGGAYDLSLTRT